MYLHPSALPLRSWTGQELRKDPWKAAPVHRNRPFCGCLINSSKENAISASIVREEAVLKKPKSHFHILLYLYSLPLAG
ncbi:sarcoplasmic/endoplasmic reticulum calcium ATPase regulator DWORF isoform X1 [Falco rusticolus]|uniref:sarcoplasmic/endoplasmic reticulum calcium ATPase regulator DWORF isoform X1 n=1 Tax=Falco rusticolus TaxID=120794 RepID=UPI000FFB5422|nr:sarcoplasmic/endoplasmic reticulum calcium ATPase regulator DWORF isoform X1 [Falco rusticolus]